MMCSVSDRRAVHRMVSLALYVTAKTIVKCQKALLRGNGALITVHFVAFVFRLPSAVWKTEPAALAAKKSTSVSHIQFVFWRHRTQMAAAGRCTGLGVVDQVMVNMIGVVVIERLLPPCLF